ncbi:MAG: PAS domain-containing protein, partial [Desulfobulbaceae bacterium]|nr:PAS domain-containing protein [Desulfobulbaceae bacterium]
MSESFDTELKKTQDEVGRLVRNRAAFYEIMSDMIFLIRDDYQIEDMNQSAISTFGDLRGKFCHKALHGLSQPCANVTCPVNLTARDQRFNELIERQIDDITIEYSFVPFQGYQGDKLVMVVMRDVSKRKK